MSLSLDEILQANRAATRAVGSTSFQSEAIARRRKEEEELARLLAAEQEPDDGGFSIGGLLKNVGGGILEGLGRISTAVTTGASFANREGQRSADQGPLDVGTIDDFFRGIGASLSGKEQVGGSELFDPERHDLTGAGNAIMDNGVRIPGTDTELGDLAQTIGGTATEIGTDPLSFLTLGTGAAARRTIGGLGAQYGDDVARAAAKGGEKAVDDLLANRAAVDTVRRAVPSGVRPDTSDVVRYDADFADNQAMDWLSDAGGVATPTAPRTLRDLLAEQLDNGLARGDDVDTLVSKQVDLINRRAGGGIGFAGYQTGIGGGLMDRLGDSALAATAPLRRLLSPTAAVGDEFGGGAASAVRQAMNTGANVRRTDGLERQRLASQFADDPDGLDEMLGGSATERVQSAMADDLADLAPRLVADEAGEGMVEFGGRYVPRAVADAFDQAKSAKPNKIVEGLDAATRAIKLHTTLNPLLNPLHVPRNMASNMLFATMYGGVNDPRYWTEAMKLRKTLAPLAEEGKKGLDLENGLRAAGLSDQEVRRAIALHDQQLVGRGGAAFDDIGDLGPKEAEKRWNEIDSTYGTRTMGKINSWHEELSRGAVFLKGLDEGLKPTQAWKKSSDAMLDYSSEGLSKFERDYIQRVMFFYKFPRRAIPRGLRFVAESPGPALAMSNAGIGINEQDRNAFGQPIGYFFDSPLEAVGSTGAELFNEEGELDPFSFATEQTNPLLKAALDPDSRRLKDILPPVGQAEALGKELGGHKTPTRWDPEVVVPGLVGVRQGQDFNLRNWEEERDERIAEDGEMSDTDRLITAALAEDIANPYDMSEARLVQELKKNGWDKNRLKAILAD